ncbi:MAG: linear amide C-N hydrolase, partial [Prevotella sp.]
MKKDGKKCLGILSNIMKWQMLVMSIAIMMTASACSDDDETTPEENSEQVQNSPEEEQTTVTQTPNGAAMITDKEKLAMLRSMKDLEGDKGRIYEIKYTADYKLDEALEFGISSTNSLKMFVAQYLLDVVPSTKTLKLSYDAGCSAFACPDNAQGEYLMGRNFDFNHLDADTKERIMIPVIAVHTAPEGGKKSVSFVDGQFLDYKSGFYTDGISDLSMLMALPYVILDGINEDGFAISVLKLDGLYAEQNESGKKKIFTTVALRMLLDKAGSVKEAIELLKNYNISMDKVAASYHFFMADAKGDYAIVEY